MSTLREAWEALPAGARAALDAQWSGLAARGLPCGAAVTDRYGNVLAIGRNHAYDPDDGRDALQNTRLAHAEFNALAHIATDVDHTALTLWSTQHPCPMCAAAIEFIGIGQVVYLADDPSDDSAPEVVAATHGNVAYRALGDERWHHLSNLLFLYTGAVLHGERDSNLRLAAERWPEAAAVALELAATGEVGAAARSGTSLPDALAEVWGRLPVTS